MSKSETALVGNLRRLYRSYGGFSAMLRSSYFWISVLFTGACWRFTTSEKWVEIAQVVLPAMAGFSIAAYAVFFAVLSENDRAALMGPAESLGGRSPLLALASSVSHAVVIQVIALLWSVLYAAKPLPILCSLENVAVKINIAGGAFGILLLVYGIVLVLGAVLSIFRLLEIRTSIG